MGFAYLIVFIISVSGSLRHFGPRHAYGIWLPPLAKSVSPRFVEACGRPGQDRWDGLRDRLSKL